MYYSSGIFPSSAGHVEPGVNLGGPSPKAKYSSATDSEKYREGKVKRTPFEGSEKEPETMCLQAVRALWHLCAMGDRVPFA